ncbi:hypothetical protein IC582_028606 [Cucumis melo]
MEIPRSPYLLMASRVYDEEILNQMLHCKSAKEIWETLQESYIRTSQNNYHNNHSYNQRGDRGNGRSNRGGRGNLNKPQCQICTKLGHSADRCFFRYTPRSNSSDYSPNSHNTSYTNMNNHPQMSAMVASPDLNIDSNWYPDFGATNHLTYSLSNLSTRFEYGGGNQIYAANGSGLPTTHYGSMSFNSSTLPFKLFTLNNLLHVPSITKNLISVSQFVKDNHVFFEFHPTLCYVKDLDTGQVLLQGLLNDRLYKFTIQPSHKDFTILTPTPKIGTQESSMGDGNSGCITQSPSPMEPQHQTDSVNLHLRIWES